MNFIVVTISLPVVPLKMGKGLAPLSAVDALANLKSTPPPWSSTTAFDLLF